MRKILWEVSVGFAGCGSDGTEEFPDGTPDSVIDQFVWVLAQEEGASWEGDERLYSAEEWEDGDVVAMFYENCDGFWEEVK